MGDLHKGWGKYCSKSCKAQQQGCDKEGELRSCHRCSKFKTGTKQAFVGAFKVRICKTCLDKRCRPVSKPKKKTVIEKKIPVLKDVYDESRDAKRWEEAEKFMNKT